MVRFFDAAVTTPPVSVKEIPDDLISAEVPSVIGRAKEGDPVDVYKAPLLETPVPLIVAPKLPVNANPFKSKAEPLATVSVPVPEPKLTLVASSKILVVEPVPIVQLILLEIVPAV